MKDLGTMPERYGRHERHNFLMNTAEGASYIASSGFIPAQTVLPALVSRLGGGNLAVGSVVAIVYVGVFLPQIFAARYVETLPWKKPWAIRFGLAQRFVVLLLGLEVLLLGASYPTAALWLFLGLFSLNQILGGVTTPGWFDLFAKLTPPDKRGRLAGFRKSLGGAAALICGLVLTWLLSTFLFPVGYAFAFFGAFVLQMISLVTQVYLVEEEPSAALPRRPIFAFLGRLPDVIRRNVEFRNFIIASIFLIIATMPVGFFTVYALKSLHANESVVGQFTLMVVATQIVSAVVNGFIADRYGNKRALLVAAAGMCCASLSALMAPSLEWFWLVFVFLGVNLGSELMTRYNICIEFGPVQQRSTLIGLMNTVLSPFYLIGLVGGWLSNALGYHAVFLVGVVFSLIGMLLLALYVRDPRAHAMRTADAAPAVKRVVD